MPPQISKTDTALQILQTIALAVILSGGGLIAKEVLAELKTNAAFAVKANTQLEENFKQHEILLDGQKAISKDLQAIEHRTTILEVKANKYPIQ